MSAARLREAALVLRDQPNPTTFAVALADWLTAASVAEQNDAGAADSQAHRVAEIILGNDDA